jgi:predicted TIM-barrel fold metal-dependent hydrolase
LGITRVCQRGDRVFIVDSHCHASPIWYEPVESLLFQMDRAGVERAVLVQMNGQPDNGYQFDAVRRFRDRLVCVAWLQADLPEACEQLRRLADQGISGVRLAASVRSPGNDPLAIWRTAADLGMTVTCGGASGEFSSRQFTALVQALPDLQIVIEHLGGENAPEPNSGRSEHRRRIFELARFSNVCIKIHGLGEFCRRRLPVAGTFPFELPIPPLLEAAHQAFGASRMMWGSDYPPVSAREGYQNSLRLTLEQFAATSDEDRALIFGGVAHRLFPPRQ